MSRNGLPRGIERSIYQVSHAFMRWWIRKKTAKLLSVFGRHISWKFGHVNLWVIAEDISWVGFDVISKLIY
jgi:hypothetical protein